MDRSSRCPRPFFETYSDLQAGTEKRTQEIVALRRELLHSNSPIVVDPNLSREQLLDLSYVIEGILSQYLWEYVRSTDIAHEPIPHDADFWSGLYRALDECEHALREHLTSVCVHPSQEEATEASSRLDQLFQGFIRCKELETGMTGTGFPSMGGLFHFGLHYIQAIVEKYEEATQEEMPFEEFLRFVTNREVYRFMLDLQSNTHAGIISLHSVLTAQPRSVVDSEHDPAADPFILNAFDIDLEAGRISPKQPVWFATQNTLTLRGLAQDQPREQRSCPVTYANFFPEIWRWLIEIISYQRYGTPYPRRAPGTPSRNGAEPIRAELREKGLLP